MKVLVVGNGGREHAMAWKLGQSRGVEVLITKGNGGTDAVARALPVSPTDIDAVIETARAEGVGLVAIGPEAPLAAGLADRLMAAGIPVFGPVQAAARLESSKAFTHEVLEAAHVPAAGWHVFDHADDALRHVVGCHLPVVVKADGLAAGKGVVVALRREEAIEAVKAFMVDGTLGHAGRRVVIEDFLVGEEASFMVITDGEHILPLAGARDHKRVFDNDMGPNTGGMGAFSPTPLLEGEARDHVLASVIRPTLSELAKRGITYKGVLYAGLMFTAEGPKVLEFNCRFGDPETQPVLVRTKGNLSEVMLACSEGRLDQVRLDIERHPAVCVVLSSAGYPEQPRVGDVIEGLNEASEVEGVHVFHAGTRRLPDGSIVTAGGRVLGVTAVGKSFRETRERAYLAASRIRFAGMHYRSDIGKAARG
jgi:phosphoribosylamine--glycine ligase